MPQYKNIYLGHNNGLEAYEEYKLVGKASYLFELEQRWFPDYEIGTVIPMFSVYLQSGNVYQEFSDFSWDEQEYMLGISMNLGMSKSVQGVINYFTLAYPIKSTRTKGFKYGFFPKINF